MGDGETRDLEAEHCYGCSPSNREGLQLRFERSGDHQVRSETTLRPELCGWKGIAHGGIVALLLDEVTSWCMALCVGERHFATRELAVRYLRPTPTGVPLMLTGELLDDAGATATFRGEVRLPDGRLTARAQVEIARLAEARYRKFAEAAQVENTIR